MRQGSLEQRGWTGVLNSGSVLAGPAILGRRLRPSPSLTFSFVKGSVAGVPVLRGLCTDQSRNSEWGESDLDKDSPGGSPLLVSHAPVRSNLSQVEPTTRGHLIPRSFQRP